MCFAKCILFLQLPLSRPDGWPIPSPREHLCFVEASTPSVIAAFSPDVVTIATAGKAIFSPKVHNAGKTPRKTVILLAFIFQELEADLVVKVGMLTMILKWKKMGRKIQQEWWKSRQAGYLPISGVRVTVRSRGAFYGPGAANT